MQQKILAAAEMDPISMPAGLMMRGRGCTRLQQLSLEPGLGWESAFSRPSCRVATPSSPGPPLADGPRNKRHSGACSIRTQALLNCSAYLNSFPLYGCAVKRI